MIVGGSPDARTAVERRLHCAETSNGDILRRDDALRLGDAAGQHPLPFLCGANAAAWTGGSWVVATGGEGDGVLIRLTPPVGG